jgi:hypothetical protein
VENLIDGRRRQYARRRRFSLIEDRHIRPSAATREIPEQRGIIRTWPIVALRKAR